MSDKKLTRSVRLADLQNFLALKTPGGGATLKEMAERLGVTSRQVYRDLDTLAMSLGVTVIRPERGSKQSGRYRLDSSFSLKISPEAAAIIFLSILKQKGSPLAVGINDIKDTLISALFKNRYGCRQEELEDLQGKVHIVEEQLLDEQKSGQVILKLMNAIKDNCVVSMRYFTPTRGEMSKRDVEPYGLASKHNVWYLVGYCRKSQERRTFRIDLIDQVYVLSEKFRFPDDFSIKAYIGDSWGIFSSDETRRVVIKVAPELAYRFRLISYHPSQKVERELGDGSVMVSYNTSGMYEFMAWVLQWGEFVEVLEPEDLRQQVRERIEAALGKYV
ncbi:MAG: WYL domain-containing protein [Firmicutes bacterium]|nr:WYL domain-containing protein [Bacillota bacterium]